MKKSRVSVLVCALILLAPLPARAQLAGASIKQLEEQIKTLEEVDRDPTTTPEVRRVNLTFLGERRARLRDLYAEKISSLKQYRERVRATLTADDLEELEAGISQLERSRMELAGFFPSTPVAAPEVETRPQPARMAAGAVSVETPPLEVDAAATNANTAAAAAPRAGQASAGCYANVPTIISTEVDRGASRVARAGGSARDAAEEVDFVFGRLFTLTITDALSGSEESNLRQLAAYQYIGETARTDKQIGASARAAGTTSASEKPGWADILGIAVENGAIQQEVSDTTMTLSTTPYAFFVPSASDTAQAYRQFGGLRRVALSATFNISNNDSSLTNARRRNLSDYSLKVRLTPDRSPRSQDFRDKWASTIKPTIQRDLNLLSGTISTVVNQPGVASYSLEVRAGLIDEIERELSANHPTRTTPEQKAAAQAAVREKILCTLQDKVFNQVQVGGTGAGRIRIDQDTHDRLLNDFIPSLFRAEEDRKRANEAVQEIFDELDRKPMASFAYTNQRAQEGSDYSVFRLLYQQHIGNSPVKMILNAGFSAYHKPDPALNQERFRDFAASFSLEGKRPSPFISRDSLDLSPMTYSLTGRYERMQENRGVPNKKADIGVVQFRVDIPLSKGFSVPLALTYANATEEQKEEHVRGNFGITFDVDKFLLLKNLLGGR